MAKISSRSVIKDYDYLIKTAIKSDIDDLFKQFSNGPLNYQHFLQCFKDVDFWSIFIGRINVADSYELDEDFFQLVASLIFPAAMRNKGAKISKSSSMSMEVEKDLEQAEKLFGIYLLYTSYFLQPQTEVKLIKLTLELAEHLPLIMDSLLAERQLYALFCLQRLISSKAFTIIPFADDYNPLCARHKRNKMKNSEDELKLNDFERLKNVTESQDLQYVSEIHQKYAELKRNAGVSTLFHQVRDDVKRNVNDIVKEAEEKLKKTLFFAAKSIRHVQQNSNQYYAKVIIENKFYDHAFSCAVDEENSYEI